MKYNKLVRDKIPDILRGNGIEPRIRVADIKEYRPYLKEKLLEEVNEFLEKESGEELADVLEVIDAILNHLGPLFDENVRMHKAKKARERGKFEKRIILEEA